MKRRYKRRRGMIDLNAFGPLTGGRNVTSIFGMPVTKRSAPLKPILSAAESNQLQNMKFALANKFANKLSEAAIVGFELDSRRKKLTGHNRLVAHLLAHAIVGDLNEVNIRYHNVSVSTGSVYPLRFAWIKLIGIGLCKLKWKNEFTHWEEEKEIRDADQIYIVIYNETTDEVLKSCFIGIRSDAQATFRVPPFCKDDLLHCWIFAKSSESKDVSNSFYIDEVIQKENQLTIVS